MDYSKKQNELDIQKWIDSETKYYDTCGEYSYCSKCNKSEAYPCAYAYERFYGYITENYQTSTPSKTKRTCTRKTSSTKTTSKAKATTTKKSSTTRKTTKVAA